MLNKGHFANFKIVAFSMPTVQILKSKTLVSLIRISPNFHTMYSNDCRYPIVNINELTLGIGPSFSMPSQGWKMEDQTDGKVISNSL